MIPSSRYYERSRNTLAQPRKSDCNVLILNLPEIPERSRISVHEAIHTHYKAEIVGGTLFIHGIAAPKGADSLPGAQN